MAVGGVRGIGPSGLRSWSCGIPHGHAAFLMRLDRMREPSSSSSVLSGLARGGVLWAGSWWSAPRLRLCAQPCLSAGHERPVLSTIVACASPASRGGPRCWWLVHIRQIKPQGAACAHACIRSGPCNTNTVQEIPCRNGLCCICLSNIAAWLLSAVGHMDASKAPRRAGCMDMQIDSH